MNEPSWPNAAITPSAVMHQAGVRSVRGAAAAAITTLLVVLEATVMPPDVWGTLAMALGATLALTLRWGRSALIGSAAAMLTAQLALHIPAGVAVASSAAALAATAAALYGLSRTDFDHRLDRPGDVGWLILAVGGLAALSTFTLVLWRTSAGMAPWSDLWRDGVARSVAVGAAALLAALPVLVLHRTVFVAPIPARQWWLGSALAITLLACAAMPLSPWVRASSWSPLVHFAPPALLHFADLSYL